MTEGLVKLKPLLDNSETELIYVDGDNQEEEVV
jgi:hypothetical protein